MPKRRSPPGGTIGAGPRAALEQRVLRSARQFADRVRALYNEIERVTGVTIGMHRALQAIAAQPGLQASALAARLGMQRPAVSQLLRTLEARGWVRRAREASDQRSVAITLTPAGGRLVRAATGRTGGALQRAVRGLGAADLERLGRALPALLAALPERTGT